MFRKENVGFNKSEAACKAAKQMNPAFNYKCIKLLVGPQNEEFFNDEFWEGLDLAVNAVDNIKVTP